MSKFFFFFILILAGSTVGHSSGFAGDSLELIADAKRQGEQIVLTVTGRTAPKFHLYSVHPQGEFGPKPTRLILEQPEFQAVGTLKESQPKLMLDQALGDNYLIHQGEFWVAQVYKSKPFTGAIRGYLFYQLCDNLICLTPVKQPFEAKIH